MVSDEEVKSKTPPDSEEGGDGVLMQDGQGLIIDKMEGWYDKKTQQINVREPVNLNEVIQAAYYA